VGAGGRRREPRPARRRSRRHWDCGLASRWRGAAACALCRLSGVPRGRCPRASRTFARRSPGHPRARPVPARPRTPTPVAARGPHVGTVAIDIAQGALTRHPGLALARHPHCSPGGAQVGRTPSSAAPRLLVASRWAYASGPTRAPRRLRGPGLARRTTGSALPSHHGWSRRSRAGAGSQRRLRARVPALSRPRRRGRRHR
jgi:hypothetical protein